MLGPPRSRARLGNPVNALLNYLYGLLGAEATMAARIVGLDPGLGVLHADQLNRDSLSTDLMEPIRPVVDGHVFDLLASRRFAADDFFETREGVCRVMPPLTRELAHAAVDWGRTVGRVAEDVARRLDAGGSGRPVATPISGRSGSDGRRSLTKPRRPTSVSRPVATCNWCGGPLEKGRRACPGECEKVVRQQGRAAFVAAGVARGRALREAGAAPTPDSTERLRMADRNSGLIAAARAWQSEHVWPEPGPDEREIVPAIAQLSAAAIARATGLSRG